MTMIDCPHPHKCQVQQHRAGTLAAVICRQQIGPGSKVDIELTPTPKMRYRAQPYPRPGLELLEAEGYSVEMIDWEPLFYNEADALSFSPDAVYAVRTFDNGYSVRAYGGRPTRETEIGYRVYDTHDEVVELPETVLAGTELRRTSQMHDDFACFGTEIDAATLRRRVEAFAAAL